MSNSSSINRKHAAGPSSDDDDEVSVNLAVPDSQEEVEVVLPADAAEADKVEDLVRDAKPALEDYKGMMSHSASEIELEPERVQQILAKAQDYLRRVDRLMVKRPEVKARDKDDISHILPGWHKAKGGGMKCVDKHVLDRQKGILSHLVKSAGAALVQGQSVVNISLPVRVFEARSFLERIPDCWCYGPYYLTRAAFAATPLERFQLVMTFLISGLHRGITQLKPFNPILGETYQAAYADGTSIVLEQVSHHPPTSQFQLRGPDDIYHLHGYHEFAASIRPNSIIGQQIGPNCVEFLDGTRIVFNMPYVLMKGTIIGDRSFAWQGTCSFADEKNNLYCDLVFNPDQKSGFSKFFGSSQKTPVDHVRGEIYSRVAGSASSDDDDDSGSNSGAPKNVRSVAEGSWLDAFGFDGKTWWNVSAFHPLAPAAVADPLPSDCRYREDLVQLQAGNEEEAQKWKAILEERQRDDRKLRKQYEKSKH